MIIEKSTDGETWQAIGSVDLVSVDGRFNSYKGFILDGEAQVSGLVRLRFIGDFIYYVQNVAMFSSLKSADVKDIPVYTEYIYNELGKYDLSTDEAFEQAYLDCVSVIIGAEYALKTYNKAVYDKATYFNKLGIGYELYYDYYFGLKNITSDKNANGTTVSGSKKAKVIQYTMAQDLSTEQKLILIMSAGYKISDGDIKGMTATQARRLVAQYITKLNLSKAEKAELAQSLGFTIKNGRIYVN